MIPKLSPKGRAIIPNHEAHAIKLTEATLRTKVHRSVRPPGIDEKKFKKASTFNRHIFDTILSNPDVCAIRFYYARVTPLVAHDSPSNSDTDGLVPTLIAIGVDKNGNDILDVESTTGMLKFAGENSWPCPPHCGAANVLNS